MVRFPVADRFRIATLALILFAGGCSSAPAVREPANLSLLKKELREYAESGRYERDIEAVAARADVWLRERAGRGGEKLTMVFDLDETLLSNLPHMTTLDFGYVPPEWDRWVEAASAPPIEPVRRLYRTARDLGIDVVFLTGRLEKGREGTERNLRAIGCADYLALICRPDDLRGPVAAFKAGIRRQLIEQQGRTLIANIGDQESDLAGGFAERVFKLPNPFYISE
jgi:hypothetical protein